MIFVKQSDFIGQYKLAQNISDADILQTFIDREEIKTLYKLLGKELADLLISYQQTPPITAGSLVIGNKYQITIYKPGDDFVNDGGQNITGNIFIATGTHPANWSNGSSLKLIIDRYQNLIDPFYLLSDGFFPWNEGYRCDGNYYSSNGVKDLLLIQIFYCYLFETQIRHSQSGAISQSSENSNVQSVANALRIGEMKWNNAGLDTWMAINWYCKFNQSAIYPEFKGIIEKARYSYGL